MKIKKIIFLILTWFYATFLFGVPTYASSDTSNKYETIISYVNLDEKVYYDVELLIRKNGEILIPFKQISEIFGVEFKVNHSNHNIDFTYDRHFCIMIK